MLTVFFSGDTLNAGSSANIDISIAGLPDYPIDLPSLTAYKGWNILNLTGFNYPNNCIRGSVRKNSIFISFDTSLGIPSASNYFLFCK